MVVLTIWILLQLFFNMLLITPNFSPRHCVLGYSYQFFSQVSTYVDSFTIVSNLVFIFTRCHIESFHYIKLNNFKEFQKTRSLQSQDLGTY